MELMITFETPAEVENAAHSIRVAIDYVNDRLKSGVANGHACRRELLWWENFMYDVKLATTLKRLLVKLEKLESGATRP